MKLSEEVLLKEYIRRYGEMTKEEALALADRNRHYAEDCGPYDPARAHFIQEALIMQTYAGLLEKQSQLLQKAA